MSVDLAIPAVSEPRTGETTRTSGFLQGSIPVYFILGTFFVVTLPFSLYAVAEPDFFKRYGGLVVFYLCFFSITHFVLTLTIYLQSANLRHFSSTRINRTVYFLVPISIFVLFNLYSALPVAAAFPAFAFLFRCAIRFFDLPGFNRETFGVVPLLKARSPATFGKWLKRAETLCCFSLSLSLLQAFLDHGNFNGDGGYGAIPLPLGGVLLAPLR